MADQKLVERRDSRMIIDSLEKTVPDCLLMPVNPDAISYTNITKGQTYGYTGAIVVAAVVDMWVTGRLMIVFIITKTECRLSTYPQLNIRECHPDLSLSTLKSRYLEAFSRGCCRYLNN